MHDFVENLSLINKEIQAVSNNKINIIAVTKTFSSNYILPLIKFGHVDFGENKVQEAENKWKYLKTKFPKINLHMVGKLQTNKVKKALLLFDYIHSLDSPKLAFKIARIQNEINKKISLFIQINFENEIKKSGIDLKTLKEFVPYCINDLLLNIIGLMCIPPQGVNPEKYFIELSKLKKEMQLKYLSMGMSDDYLQAAKHGATHLRIGTKIFGPRV